MNIEQLQKFATHFPAVPVTLQFQLTSFDPIAITQAFDQPDSPCFLLTGKPKKTEDGFSFIGVNPSKSFTYRNGRLTIKEQDNSESTETVELKPVIEKFLKKIKHPASPTYRLFGRPHRLLQL